MRFIRFSVCALTLCAAALLGRPADATTLPVIVDQTGAAPAFWWADDTSAPAGEFDRQLFESAEHGNEAWLSPRAARPSGTVSRLFRTVDITPNNARQLAGLYGAQYVLVGQLTREGASTVPWLGLQRVALVLDAAVVDVTSGATVGQITIRRVAHGEASVAFADVAAALVAAADGALTGQVQRSSGEWSVVEEDVVLIHSPDGAQPYSAFRGALREVHPGVVDVAEAWASEGWIALRLELDEGVTFQDVAGSLSRLDGADLGLGRVTDVSVEPRMVYVEVRAGTGGDSARP